MKNPKISTPNQFLNFFSARVPDVWKAVDYYRHERGSGEDDWDARVFMPLSGWNAITERLLPKSPVDAQVFAAKNLQVMGAWRPTQDILRFDADFYNMLTKTPVTGNLPVEIIGRIPAWALYFETRNLAVEGRSYDGFFAGLDQSNDRTQLILRLHFVAVENMRILPFILPLGDWSVEEAVERTNAQQRNAMMRLNMEMTGEYTRVADQGLHAAQSFVLCLFLRSGRRQGIRVRPRHTLSAAGKGQKGQLAFVPAAKAGNSQTGNRNRGGNEKIQ